MRSIHKMYKVVQEEAQRRQRDTSYGLCHLIQDAKYADSNSLSDKEEEALIKHFKKHRPMRSRKHPFHSFAYNSAYRWNVNEDKPRGAYWWETDKEGKKQRLLFLEALIVHTRPWYIKLWDRIWWM